MTSASIGQRGGVPPLVEQAFRETLQKPHFRAPHLSPLWQY